MDVETWYLLMSDMKTSQTSVHNRDPCNERISSQVCSLFPVLEMTRLDSISPSFLQISFHLSVTPAVVFSGKISPFCSVMQFPELEEMFRLLSEKFKSQCRMFN